MAHGGEDAGRRGPPVLERRRVRRHRPAIRVGQGFLELRHRRPGDADRDLAVDVHEREPAHRHGVGQVRGWRPLDRGRLGAVAASLVAVAAGALLAVDLGAARGGGRPGGEWDDRAAGRAGDAVGDVVGHTLHRVGGRRGGEQRHQAPEPRVGRGAGGARQKRHVEAGLLEELAGFVDFRGGRHLSRGAGHAHAVFLGGERDGGDDAPRRRQRIRSLPREWRGEADDK